MFFSHCLFVLSIICQTVNAGFLSVLFGKDARERFWVFIAVFGLQLGATALALSVIEQVVAPSWAALNLVLTLVLLAIYARKRSLGTAAREMVSSLCESIEGIRSLSTLGLVLFLALLLVFAVSAWEQWTIPLMRLDEWMYHASRVGYWMQHQSVFPYETHNIRQIVFPWGGEVHFLWPVLFTRSECVGRMVFWLALPLTSIGIYTLVRELGGARALGLAAATLFASTPTILTFSNGLKPDIWVACYVVATGFWAARAARLDEPSRRSFFFGMLGLSIAQAANVKPTSLVLLGAAALLLWLGCDRTIRCRVASAGGIGLLTGLVFSGLGLVFTWNVSNYGHPLGPGAFRAVHTPTFSFIQSYTHAIRTIFFLIELPEVPPQWAPKMAASGNDLIKQLGAADTLDMEDKGGSWPGAFAYRVPIRADQYSLGGFLWLPALAIAGVILLRDSRDALPRIKLTPLTLVALMDFMLLCVMVFTIRWMLTGPSRFWIAPYALGLPVTFRIGDLLSRRIPALRALGLIAMVPAIYVPAYICLRQIAQFKEMAPASMSDSTGFAAAVRAIPQGSRILLIAQQDAPDYPLFDPLHAFPNKVVSWGIHPFDSKRLLALVEQHHLTHILVQDDRELKMHWDANIATAEMTRWLASNPALEEIPAATPHQRIFRVKP